MASDEKFIVIPYRKVKGNLVAGEMRQSSNAGSAERLAAAQAGRFAGVAAYGVRIDTESGDMSSPRLIASHGEIPDLLSSLEAE